MKKRFLLPAFAAVALLAAQPLFSQSARPVRTPREELQAIKAANQKLLEQQGATLQRLDEMQKEAGQLRILVRRT